MIVGLRTMIVRNYDKVYTIMIVVDKSIVLSEEVESFSNNL